VGDFPQKQIYNPFQTFKNSSIHQNKKNKPAYRLPAGRQGRQVTNSFSQKDKIKIVAIGG